MAMRRIIHIAIIDGVTGPLFMAHYDRKDLEDEVRLLISGQLRNHIDALGADVPDEDGGAMNAKVLLDMMEALENANTPMPIEELEKRLYTDAGWSSGPNGDPTTSIRMLEAGNVASAVLEDLMG